MTTESNGLSHLAMSVPPGTLTDEFRTTVIDFYGTHFGWTEMESLRLPDRMTLSVGGGCYINIRERDEEMVCFGYEHFGLLMPSSKATDDVWAALDADERDLQLEPLKSGEDGYRSFRFRYLMPMAVEVQHFP